MSQKEKIQRIIDQRQGEGDFLEKGHLQKIESKLKFLSELKKQLADYGEFRNSVIRQIEEGGGVYYQRSLEDVSFEQNVREASTDRIISRIEKCENEYNRLKERFERDSICISVVGGAGSGKSTLLQSISGLENSVVPASDGSDCTGTQSIICNSESEKTSAKIDFYTIDEITAHVRKYLEAIGVDDRFHVNTLDDISRLAITDIRSSIQKEGLSKKDSLCTHLEKYVTNLSTYKDKLGTSEKVEEKDIIRYVAQHAVDNEQEKYYLYLAVKKACIFKRFDYEDAGKIVLIDTIGMGDTSLGIREKMIKTLHDDSDASILLFRSDRGLRDKDNENIDFIRENMQGTNLGKWMFWVANDFGDNGTQALFNSLTDKKKYMGEQCAALYRIKCNDKDDVRENLLIPLLDKVIANLSEIDNSLLRNVNDLAGQIYADYYELCGKIARAMSGDFKQNTNVTRLFNRKLYNDCPPFSQALVALENDFRDKSNSTCKEIEETIKDIYESIYDFCPTKDEILARLRLGTDAARPINVYQYYADSIRNQIKLTFDKGINNDCIVGLQTEMKRKIISLLYNEGGFSTIPLLETVDNKDDVIDWMRCFLQEVLSDYPVLKETCEKLVNFRLNIEGSINYKLNKCLQEPYNPNANIFGTNIGTQTLDQIANEIEQYFLWAVDGWKDKLLEELADTIVAPYNLFYDLINSFRDRLIFSPEGKRELYDFYFDHCSVIWRDEIIGASQAQSVISKWNEMSKRLSKLAVKNDFVITI